MYSGITESLFRVGQTFIWGGGGENRGRHRNDFSPSHLLCTIKSQMGVHGVNGEGGGDMPPIVTPLIMYLTIMYKRVNEETPLFQ